MEHDQGADTQQRYRIQAGLAALYALNMLEDGSAVVAISVESGEDFVEERNDGSFVYCQVKTRLIDRGAFPFGDKEIRDALANFVVADRIFFPGLIRKFALISNIGHRPSQDHKIDTEDFLNCCSDSAFLGSVPSQKMAQKIAKRAMLVLGRLDNAQTRITVDDVQQVMNRVSLRVERFELGFIDQLVEHGLRNSRFTFGIARDAMPELARSLIDRLVFRSAKGEELHIPGSIPLAEDFKATLAARRSRARQFTKLMLTELIEEVNRDNPREVEKGATETIHLSDEWEIDEPDVELHDKLSNLRDAIRRGKPSRCKVIFRTPRRSSNYETRHAYIDARDQMEQDQREIAFAIKLLLIEQTTHHMLPRAEMLGLAAAIRRLVPAMKPNAVSPSQTTTDRPFQMFVARQPGGSPFFQIAVSADTIQAVVQHHVDIGQSDKSILTADISEMIREMPTWSYVADLPAEIRSKTVLQRAVQYLVREYHQASFDEFVIDQTSLGIAYWYISFAETLCE
ncbi:DUF4297 domain-containing protein (plasmid) [Rhizobium ruizarguesonis]|uniref:dsDNA nuclease domain-containing protein n=1 Tax=Rhizobium ruizarguesonis TaxID=2081791 RepID=UPI001031D46F|nr:dsDNA nuclease domain-containing protein [Rhizobium ruizarguesonis]TBA94360.1 DUF4297 domain-containing protein [Rhizobium ruizarguesonis]